MNRIYKYTLRMEDLQTVTLPEDAEILTAQVQHGEIQLWAKVPVRVNPEMYDRPRNIHIVGTGHVVPEGDLKYISTVQFSGGGGQLVLHIFSEEP